MITFKKKALLQLEKAGTLDRTRNFMSGGRETGSR